MGVKNFLTRSYQAMFGTARDEQRIERFREGESAPPDDRITTNPFPPPYQEPGSLDNYGRETDLMREEYQRFYASEPTLQSALDGKAAAVASLDVSVLPCDEKAEADKYVAEFCRKAIENCDGGWPGLILNLTLPAFVNGFSITEKWMGGVDNEPCFDRLRPKYNGLWSYKRLASIDTNRIKLQINPYREVIGVVNTQLGLMGYSTERAVIYTHRKVFENPYGRSDIRSAYRACQMIQSAYKLWYIALNNYASPYLVAKTAAVGSTLEMLRKALAAAKSGGYLTLSKEDEIELLNFAGATSFQAFEAKVRIAREEIYQAVRGAYLPFLQGGQKNDQGNTETHKVASDSIEYLIVQSVVETINKQLIPDLVRPNFGERVGLPSVTLGGTNWNETKQQLEVIRIVEKDLGRPVSTAHIYKVAQVEPPRDKDDGPPPALPAWPMGPMGPMGSTGAPGPFGQGATPALPAAPTLPALPAAGQSSKPAGAAPPTNGNEPNHEGNTAPVVTQGASERLNTVGGAGSILTLQKDYVAGNLTRAMAIANATAIYGIARENVDALFPPEAEGINAKPTAEGGAGDKPATFSESTVTNFADVFIANADGQVLLLKRRPDDPFQPSTWCLPGGKTEPGEEPMQSAIREIREETGIALQELTAFKTYPTEEGGNSFTFTARVEGEPKVRLSAEHTQHLWWGRSYAMPLRFMLDTPQRLADYFAANEPTETFAEQKEEPKPAKPEAQIAIAGPDGQAAIKLTERAMADGRAILESITRDAVMRKLEAGKAEGSLFTPDELALLAETIAASNATAELLGRYRIREQMQDTESTLRFIAFDAADTPLRVKPIPPEEALRYFRDLMPSLSEDPEFDDRHRRTSFTLAENTGEVMLRAVQDAITEALAKGTTGTYAVQSILDAAGVTPRNPQYAEMVFRTNALDSYNTGYDDERQDPDVAEEFPVWQYEGIKDGRQGSDHAPHFGKYYPASVSFNEVRGDRPFNCRCTQRVVNRREWARLEAAGARAETEW